MYYYMQYEDRTQRPASRSSPPAQVRTPPPLPHPARPASRLSFPHPPPLRPAHLPLRQGQAGAPRLVSHLYGRGKKRVEHIPNDWVEEVQRLVEAGREFKEAVAEVFAANAQLLALGRKQRRSGEGAVAASPEEVRGEVSASEVLLTITGRWPQAGAHSGDRLGVGFVDGGCCCVAWPSRPLKPWWVRGPGGPWGSPAASAMTPWLTSPNGSTRR